MNPILTRRERPGEGIMRENLANVPAKVKGLTPAFAKSGQTDGLAPRWRKTRPPPIRPKRGPRRWMAFNGGGHWHRPGRAQREFLPAVPAESKRVATLPRGEHPGATHEPFSVVPLVDMTPGPRFRMLSGHSMNPTHNWQFYPL